MPEGDRAGNRDEEEDRPRVVELRRIPERQSARVVRLRRSVDPTRESAGDGSSRLAQMASRALRKRRSRRLLLTTKMLDPAIAAAAIIGLRSPATARGMAATL